MSDTAALLEQGLQHENEGQAEVAVGIYQEIIEREPSNALAYLYKGLARVRDSEQSLALPDLEKAAELDPNIGKVDPNSDLGKRIDWAIKVFEWETTVESNSAPVYLQLARVLKAFGRLERAQMTIGMVIQLHPDNWDAAYLTAKIAMLQGRYDTAVKELQQLVRGRSNEPTMQFELGLAYDKLGSGGPAQRHLEKACALDPGRPEYRVALADLALRQGRFPNAVQGFESALKLAPDHPDALLGLARCNRAQYQFELALESYQKALDARPDDAEIEAEMAEIYLQIGQPERALATLVRQAEANPDDLQCWLKVAKAADESGNLSRALDAYQRVLSLDAANHGIWAQLAEVQARGGQFEDALHSLSQATALDPAETRYILVSLDLLRRVGRTDQARDVLLRAAAQHTGSFELQLQAGMTLLEMGNYEGAWRALSGAVRLRPDQAQAQWGLGQVFLRQQKLDEAFACFRAALKLEPRHLGTLLGLAQICRLRGDAEMAQDFLDQAMELQPGALPLLEEMGHLAVLEKRPAAVAAIVARLVEAVPDPARLWPVVEQWSRALHSSEPFTPFARRHPGYGPAEELLVYLSTTSAKPEAEVEEPAGAEEELASGEELVAVEEELASGEELVAVEEELASGEELVTVEEELASGEELVAVEEELASGEELVTVEEELASGEELVAVEEELASGEELVAVEEELASGEELVAVEEELASGEELVAVEEELASGEELVAVEVAPESGETAAIQVDQPAPALAAPTANPESWPAGTDFHLPVLQPPTPTHSDFSPFPSWVTIETKRVEPDAPKNPAEVAPPVPTAGPVSAQEVAEGEDSEPFEPEQAAEPVEEAPVEPEQAAGPVEEAPVEPEQAAEPVEEAPVEPEQAAGPVEEAPVEPEQAAEPVEEAPVVPEQAAEPLEEAPVEPEQAAEPVEEAPVEPEQAAEPVEEAPVEPEQAAEPVEEAPVEPEQAAEPVEEAPVEPEQAAEPVEEAPVEPEQAAEPVEEAPVEPEQAAEPVEEAPVEPEQAAEPLEEAPVEPEQAAEPLEVDETESEALRSELHWAEAPAFLPSSPDPVDQLGPRHKLGRAGEKALELSRGYAQAQADQMATLRELYRLEKQASEAGLWLGMEHSLAALEMARHWLTMAPESLPVREFFLTHSLDLASALEEAAATEEAVYILDSCLDLIDEPTVRLKLAALCGVQARQRAEEGSYPEAVRLAQRRVELLPELPESSQLRDECLRNWAYAEPVGAEMRAFQRAQKRAGLNLVVKARPPVEVEEAEAPIPAGNPEELRALLLDNPEDRSLHLQLEELIHGEARVAYYRELVSHKTDSLGFLAGLARAYVATGQFQLAVVQFQKALKLGPDVEVSEQLAETYDKLGKPKMADKIRAAVQLASG